MIGTTLNNATANIPVSEVVLAANLSLAALGYPFVVLNGGTNIDDVQIKFDNLGPVRGSSSDTYS
jgi:hypothetical protein